MNLESKLSFDEKQNRLKITLSKKSYVDFTSSFDPLSVAE